MLPNFTGVSLTVRMSPSDMISGLKGSSPRYEQMFVPIINYHVEIGHGAKSTHVGK